MLALGPFICALLRVCVYVCEYNFKLYFKTKRNFIRLLLRKNEI